MRTQTPVMLQHPQQRSGVHIDPDTARQLCELATQSGQQLPDACQNLDATILDKSLELVTLTGNAIASGAERTARFINSDAPAIRNITSVFGSLLGATGGWIGIQTFVRNRPAILEKRVNLPVLDQKSEMEDPIADAFALLETVAEKCEGFVQDEALHYTNTIKQATAAQQAKKVIRSMVVREKESTEFGAGSTNKSGINLSTLFISGMNAPATFPKRNKFANNMYTFFKGTPLEEWATHLRNQKVSELSTLRRDQKTIMDLARFEAKVKPIRRLHFEQGIAPYGEWRNWNTPYGNYRKADLYGKKLTWNNFNGAGFSEAKLGKSKWFFNDIVEADFRGAELFNTRFARVDGRGARFSPYVENALEPSNNVIHVTNLEGAHFNCTDYEPLLTNEWYNVENDFSQADFRSANLKNTFVQQANFEGADFRKAFYDTPVKQGATVEVTQDMLYNPEQNMWVRNTLPGSADFTGSTWGKVNARDIKAEGVRFEGMKFLNEIPRVEVADIGEKQSITYRTKEKVQALSFANAKLQSTSWKDTELLQVDKEGNVLENAQPAVSFAGANISGADLSKATVNSETIDAIIQQALNDEESLKLDKLKPFFAGSYYEERQLPLVTTQQYGEEDFKKILKKLEIKQKGLF